MKKMRIVASALLCLFSSQTLGARQPVRAKHGMVVARERHATDVGESILEAGGNAVDAAVAVAFTLAVTHPYAGNLGGGGFMLVRFADGKSSFLDFRERGPAAASRNMYLGPDGHPTADSLVGYRASGIPGTVRGMAYAHQKWGKTPWKKLLNPAVALAEKGFPVSWGLSQSLQSKSVSEKLGKFPDSKRIFLRGGQFYQLDEKLVQRDLGRTLRRIRDKGDRDFYEGQTAHLLAADMKAHGGIITLEDLKNYKAIERTPLTGTYRGYDILTSPPPSSGGVGILQMLGVLEGTDYAKSGAGSAAVEHMLAETMRRFFADRSEHFGDPDFFKVPVAALLNTRYITSLRESIDPSRATPSASIKPVSVAAYESSDTTHFSIVDAQGNAVSVTYTLNGGFGSGVTAEKLGFLLNNEMDDFAAKPGEPNLFGLIQGEANSVAPNKTPLSSMVPTIITKDGKLFLVLGAPGGPTIINTVLQTILNTIDFRMNAQDAVDQPRIHHQWLPDELHMERSFSPDTIDILKAKGHKVVMTNAIGDIAAILFDGQWLQGAPDSRTEATAKGY